MDDDMSEELNVTLQNNNQHQTEDNSLMLCVKLVDEVSLNKYLSACYKNTKQIPEFSVSCLICKQENVSNFYLHNDLMEHKNVFGTLCLLCNLLMIDENEENFCDHIISDFHYNKLELFSQQNKKEVIRSEELKIINDSLKKLFLNDNSPDSKVITSNMDNKNIKKDLKAPLINEQVEYQTRQEKTYEISGLKAVGLRDMYNVLRIHGQISFLAVHYSGNSAYVKFDKMISTYLPARDLGADAIVNYIKKPLRREFDSLKESNMWNYWTNENISFECKDFFTVKRIWEENLGMERMHCEKTFNRYELFLDELKFHLSKVLIHHYPHATISFYGPCVTGLFSGEDHIQVYIGGIPDDTNNIVMRNLFKKVAKPFTLEKNDEKLPQENEYVLLNFKGLVSCSLSTNALHFFESSLMIKTYADFNPQVRFLLITVKKWWHLNDPYKLSSLSSGDSLLEWFVIFFLMTTINDFPCVKKLMQFEDVLEEGQVNQFLKETETMQTYFGDGGIRCDDCKLLVNFLMFYNELNLYNIAMIPHTGEMHFRETFFTMDPKYEQFKNDTFIMVSPFNDWFNILSTMTKKDYYFFRCILKSTINYMIS